MSRISRSSIKKMINVVAVVVALAIISVGAQGSASEQVIATAKIAAQDLSPEVDLDGQVIAESTILRNHVAKVSNKFALTYAQSGEGVIRIVTRVCGTADNWRSVAADNKITPPVYLVHLGQQLSVDCLSQTPAAPEPAPPAPQPVAAAVAVQTSSGWTHPLPGTCYNGGDNGFHTSARPNHDGVDLGAGFGTPIRAAASGTVSVGWQSGGAGNYTMINHGDGIWSVYMHQTEFARTSGWVGAGDVIGYVGSTGNSFGPHLHFEVHTGGLWYGKVNPVPWLQDRGVGIWC